MIDTSALVSRIKKTQLIDIIQSPVIGENTSESEFLIFLKPEMFMAPNDELNIQRVDVVLQELAAFDVRIDGMIAVNGRFIEEKQIMANHYGLINTMSNKASALVTPEDRKTMTKLLGEDCTTTTVLGGHEALKKFPQFTPQSLDEFWFTRKSLRVRSGYYFQKYEIDNQACLLVNAFHPYQLAYFTDPSHFVLLLVCHSNTAWKTLRWQMIGDTFPEKADPGSVRGALCARYQALGFSKKVDISCNGIHFSVGPFEALRELNNFIGNALGRNIIFETAFAKRMLEKGIPQERIELSLQNPLVSVAGQEKELFASTEDTDPDEAIEIYR
jgi:nucleoside diphosphate kinase